GQLTEWKTEDCVQQSEYGTEQTERRVAQAPLTPDPFSHSADDLAVEEVHEVDRKENDQCVNRSRSLGILHFALCMCLERVSPRVDDGIGNAAARADCIYARAGGQPADELGETGDFRAIGNEGRRDLL